MILPMRHTILVEIPETDPDGNCSCSCPLLQEEHDDGEIMNRDCKLNFERSSPFNPDRLSFFRADTFIRPGPKCPQYHGE